MPETVPMNPDGDAGAGERAARRPEVHAADAEGDGDEHAARRTAATATRVGSDASTDAGGDGAGDLPDDGPVDARVDRRRACSRRVIEEVEQRRWR